jgi:hypothetical protein
VTSGFNGAARNKADTPGPLQGLGLAFLWHWHLLALGSVAAFALLGRLPSQWLPFIVACEASYLLLFGLLPGLRGTFARGGRATGSSSLEDDFQRLLSFLSPEDDTRFRILHQRCSELLQLRRAMDSGAASRPGEDFRAESLERLLWLFLKLLHQRSGLRRFLDSTRREDIEIELARARDQLEEARLKDADSPVPGRLAAAIAERVHTITERLQNHQSASERLEIVNAEVEKTSQQITHLCETGLTMPDSSTLSARIDAISASVLVSEKTFATAGLDSIFGVDDDQAPPLLSVPPRGLASQ